MQHIRKFWWHVMTWPHYGSWVGQLLPKQLNNSQIHYTFMISYNKMSWDFRIFLLQIVNYTFCTFYIQKELWLSIILNEWALLFWKELYPGQFVRYHKHSLSSFFGSSCIISTGLSAFFLVKLKSQWIEFQDIFTPPSSPTPEYNPRRGCTQSNLKYGRWW